MKLEMKAVSSPADSFMLDSLKSSSIFINNSQTAWCTRMENVGNWVTIDFGKTRSVNYLTTLGYPIGTEPSYDNFTLQVSEDNKNYLDYTEDGKIKVIYFSCLSFLLEILIS